MTGSALGRLCLLSLAALAIACGQPESEGAGPSDGALGAAVTGHFQMENLNRGVVAVQVSNGVYVGWRMFGWEYDAGNPSAISYNVYRNGTRIASVTNSTNYLDTAGSSSSTYAVSAVVSGAEQAPSAAVAVWAQNYLRIPLQIPAGGTTPSTCPTPNESYSYSANDASVGDVDGDGEYEIVLKWDPSNAKDNSQAGCTGNVYLDAYKLNGTRLWRIDLGRNIRAGAHYTQFVVYDFDGDGKAELAVKTAPGTRDGTGAYLHLGPAASDSDTTDYRNSSGYVLSGPEYLTVFAGSTGAELATVNFDVPRGTVSAWGDSYGNRVDRFLASVGFVSDAGGGSKSASGRPSIIMARGYYTRATITAWNWRNGALTEVWKADSNSGTAYTGQGAHTMALADVDGDGAQEIAYGASMINSNGTARCTTNYGHGDALHVGAFVPGRSGLQVFMAHEDGTKPSWDVHDASTCQIIRNGPVTGNDTGRGVCDDVYAGNAGAEAWASGNGGLTSVSSGANVGSMPASSNFLVWWDADETRELEDGVSVTKYGGGTLLTCSSCASNNGTKSTPSLTADLLGDWREEVVWRESNNSALRIYTTTDVTTRRIYTLMHDPQYRVQVSSEQTAYNQPPHPSFAIGSGMAAPPKPDIGAPGGSNPTTYTLSLGLTLSTGGSGSISPAAGTYTHPAGTVVTVTATPASGSVFAGWSGACSGTSPTCTISMTKNQTATATFAGQQQQGGPMSINAGGGATGTFVADVNYSGGSTYSVTTAVDTSTLAGAIPPQGVLQTERYGEFTYTIPGLSAGNPYAVTLYFQEAYWTAAGQRTFNVAINGSTVLTAFDIFAAAGGTGKAIARSFNTSASAAGQIVIQFSKGGGPDNPKVCGITVEAASTNPNRTLTVTRAGAGSGTITSTPSGVSCGATCSAGYAAGTTVTLTATPASGATFEGWSGAISGTANPATVVLDADRAVVATFSAQTTSYTLTIAATGNGTTSPAPGAYVYAAGTVVAVTATPSSGATFSGWSGAASGTSNPVSVTVNANQTLTATFSGGGTTTPCANPVTMTGGQSGSFNTTGAVCLRTSGTVNGWGCSNFDGRTVSVNGGTAVATCGAGPLPLAKSADGYTYFGISAGAYTWGSLYYW